MDSNSRFFDHRRFTFPVVLSFLLLGYIGSYLTMAKVNGRTFQTDPFWGVEEFYLIGIRKGWVDAANLIYFPCRIVDQRIRSKPVRFDSFEFVPARTPPDPFTEPQA